MIRPIVAPPYEVQRRAWECAWMLRQEFADRLPLAHRVQAEVIYRTDPAGLGWQEIAVAFALYRAAVEVRV